VKSLVTSTIRIQLFGTLSVGYAGAYEGCTSPEAVSEITDCHAMSSY